MSLNKSKSLRTAEKYVLQGKIPAAIDEYRKVVDADPRDLTTINTLGDLYVRAGRIQDAISNFSRIADSYRESGFTLKAIAMLKKISKLDPTNVETSMKLANLYSQQGLLVEARQQYLQVADTYARAGQTRKALEAYQKIADLDPSNTSVRMKLGEIYSREGMTEQAHEAFIMAGGEFLRKGDIDQALNANLKAISVNPESRQGLTAIATIYTEQGQAERAINILCDAFENNPGDVELLTILGRTYLSAGQMDDAERTFLSLVELDRERYSYLLEVGRVFLQRGDLDRASEQIDGCLDVLIAKREEDKAIDFLRRVLDRDMNHLGSLKRMAQIFLRIREDHNLISALNSLVEAAMRKGNDAEAIEALKELVRLEPDEPMHRQRLYNLGVQDIVEEDASDVVRATSPLDYQSAAFDETFVIRQISEAEILAGHGQIDHSVTMLKEILKHAPENVQVHLKLKDIYLRAGMTDDAAMECMNLARIYEARGESSRAGDYYSEAHQLNPSIESSPVEETAADQSGTGWSSDAGNAFGYEAALGAPAGDQSGNGDGGFESAEAEGFDLGMYNTGSLTGQDGFVTVSEEEPYPLSSNGSTAGGDHEFRYSDTLVGDENGAGDAGGFIADAMFGSAGNLPSDTMPSELRDELEGIDFYIAQGYVEIARDTLDRLRQEHGDHPEIMTRLETLGTGTGALQGNGNMRAAKPSSPLDLEQPAIGTTYFQDMPGEESRKEAGATSGDGMMLMVDDESADNASVEDDSAEGEGFAVTVSRAPEESEHKNFKPFLVHKESSPLDQDLMVQFNTSELLNNTEFDPLRPRTGNLPQSLPVPIETGELVESIVSDFEASIESLKQYREASSARPTPEPPMNADDAFLSAPEAMIQVQPPDSVSGDKEVRLDHELSNLASGSQASDAGAINDELHEIFAELSEKTGDLERPGDYETHYSLGLAYKDMDLLDDAIEQFQMAFRVAAINDSEGNYIQCCHMLGVCFNRKDMPKVAIMWFQRGLRVTGRTEDEYQALRYEIGVCYEEMGETDKAIDMYSQVYGVDVNYRLVGDKIKQLQAAKNT